MYLGDSPTTATLEVQQDLAATKVQQDTEVLNATNKRKVWIARIQVVTTITVVDVRIPFSDESTFQPTLLQGLIYQGTLRQARKPDDKSNPQYRVTQYIADLVRRRKLDGIIYTSTQEYPFELDVFGTNLVLLQLREDMLNVMDFALYQSYEKPSTSLFDVARLELERIR